MGREGKKSSLKLLVCGVPQILMLSPLLFNIDMRVLGKVIHQIEIKHYQNADYNQLYILNPGRSSNAVKVLSQCQDL